MLPPPPSHLESFDGVLRVSAAELAGVAEQSGRLGVVGAVHLFIVKLTQHQVDTNNRRRRWKVAGGCRCRGEGRGRGGARHEMGGDRG